MSAKEFVPSEVGEVCLDGSTLNPDSLEDIPSAMVRSEELKATEVFYETMGRSATSHKGSPAHCPSGSAIRRAASVTCASNEDFRDYLVAGHMSPTIASRRRRHHHSDTESILYMNRRRSKDKDKDTISLPCSMSKPTPRENRACRKRIELSHRNHLDFPHEHYHDHPHDHHHHQHHHHHPHNNKLNDTNNHSHSNSHGNNNGQSLSHNHTHGQNHNGGHALGSSPKPNHGYASEVSAEEYLTPLQRKDQVIRALKEDLKKAQKTTTDQAAEIGRLQDSKRDLERAIEKKTSEIEQIKQSKNIEIGRLQEKMANLMEERRMEGEDMKDKIRELNELIRDRELQSEKVITEKSHEIHELREKVEELEFNYDELIHVYEEAEANAQVIEKECQTLRDEMETRDVEHQDMYLAMFQKGKQCHNFERQEELENLGRDDPNQVMVGELIEKLENTESKLGRWQTIKTVEIYADATNRPESEADARLHFLRDSLFHYIMDPPNSLQHLRAMAGIVDFTHAQREQVDKVLVHKEKGAMKVVKEKLTEKKKVVQFVLKEKREEVMDKIRERRMRRNSHH